MISRKIGTGNLREMEIFADEVNRDIKKLGYNLNASVEVIKIEKYGETINSNFGNVILIGKSNEIDSFIEEAK